MKSVMIALMALTCTLTAPAQAERSAPAVEVAAALSLAEAGIAAQKAAFIVTALEILADYTLIGQGFSEAKGAYASEARFLMRGDAELAQRLNATELPAPADAPAIWVFPFQRTVVLPTEGKVRLIAATHKSILYGAGGGPSQICKPRSDAWHCGFGPEGRTLHLDGYAAQSAWLAIEIVPTSP